MKNLVKPLKRLSLLPALLGLSFVGQQALGQEVTVAAVLNPACASDSSDTFDQGFTIASTSQLYSGACINSLKFRPGKILSQAADKLVFANLLHEDRFWTATIPLDPEAFDAAYFQIVRFPVVKGVEAAHTEIRIKLAKGQKIELQSQSGPSKTTSIGSLIYSVEAAFPENVNYNFALGVMKNYPLSGRLVSGTQRIKETPTHGFEQYTLKLNKQQIAALVLAAVQRSQALSLSSFYNTISPNCTTEAFYVLDRLPGRPAVRPFYTVLSPDPIAGPSLKALRARNLLGPQVKDMEEELPPHKKMVSPGSHEPVVPGPLRQDDKFPLTLITLLPSGQASAQVQSLVRTEIMKALHTSMPALMEAAVTPALLSGSTDAVLTSLLIGVEKEMIATLRRINSKLPDQPVDVLAYFAPWNGPSEQASLVGYGYPADLPFNELVDLASTPEKTKSVMSRVMMGMRYIQSTNYKIKGSSPVFYLGSMIKMKLQKNKSELKFQSALSMVPGDLKFSTSSDQVELNKIVLQAPDQNMINQFGQEATPKSAVIISNSQKYWQRLNSVVQFDFGSLKNFGNLEVMPSFGEMEIQKDLVGCAHRVGQVPELRGYIKSNLTKNAKVDGQLNPLVAGKPLALGIYSFKMAKADDYCYDTASWSAAKAKVCSQFENSKSGVLIEDMHIGVRALGLQCLEVPYVDDVVTENANEAVDADIQEAAEQLKQQAQNSDLFKSLLGAHQ
jgi:hypothetical protein